LGRPEKRDQRPRCNWEKKTRRSGPSKPEKNGGVKVYGRGKKKNGTGGEVGGKKTVRHMAVTPKFGQSWRWADWSVPNTHEMGWV